MPPTRSSRRVPAREAAASVTDDGALPLHQGMMPEIVLVEDEDGFVELVELLVMAEGRRPRVFPAAGAVPPRGRVRHRPRLAEDVDEAASTGVYLRVSLRGISAGPWMPLPRGAR